MYLLFYLLSPHCSKVNCKILRLSALIRLSESQLLADLWLTAFSFPNLVNITEVAKEILCNKQIISEPIPLEYIYTHKQKT